MKTEQKIFNDLINTIVNNSTDNTATISNVKLWAESWQREMEEALTITDVVVSEACKCEKSLPYELMPFKCHKCKGEIKKSETELVCFETGKRCTKGSTYYCNRLCVGKVLKTN